MLKRIFILWLLLMTLNQFAGAVDVILTAESDKPAYMVGDTANFTGRLRNLSQDSYIEDADVEYIFTFSQDGLEVWRWSRRECG